MITAKEALSISEENDSKYLFIMTDIEKEIIARAKEGHTYLSYNIREWEIR